MNRTHTFPYSFTDKNALYQIIGSGAFDFVDVVDMTFM